MSVYYIKATVGDGDINIALDATTEIVEGFVAELPSFKLEDGTEGSDHHTLKAPIISFKGILSDIKSLSSGFRNDDGLQTTEKTRTEDGALRWRSVKDNKDALIFIYKNHLPLSIFTDQTSYSDCYITGLGFTQNSKHGVVNGRSSIEVSITVKQPVRGSRARAVAERDLAAIKAYQDKVKENGAKRQNDEYEEALKGLSDYYQDQTKFDPLKVETEEVFEDALKENIEEGRITEGSADFYRKARERLQYFRSFK